MKKIKVFLGGYINSTNAQNLNCLALAKHLDKEKFDVYALELYSGELQSRSIVGVKSFYCFYPHKISIYMAYFWGILKSDVVYLPKVELAGWNRFWLKLLRKKSFKTVEGILDHEAIVNLAISAGSQDKVIKDMKGFENLYSITAFMSQYNKYKHGLLSQKRILHLGTDIATFLNEEKTVQTLDSIILIGNDLIRKGIYDYLELANLFTQVKFHIVGTGNGKIDINDEVKKRQLENIVYHGGLSHDKLVKLLKEINLHILPSHSEGFPKVILETAAAGVPSLVYSDYGASEWMRHGENGFVVDTLDKMKESIQMLIDNPQALQQTSKNAIAMAKQFDWKIIIKEWETVIMDIVKK